MVKDRGGSRVDLAVLRGLKKKVNLYLKRVLCPKDSSEAWRSQRRRDDNKIESRSSAKGCSMVTSGRRPTSFSYFPALIGPVNGVDENRGNLSGRKSP